jgi:hypothetical protein
MGSGSSGTETACQPAGSAWPLPSFSDIRAGLPNVRYWPGADGLLSGAFSKIADIVTGAGVSTATVPKQISAEQSLSSEGGQERTLAPQSSI